jgi:cell wall-associated NlpC family hydrolase
MVTGTDIAREAEKLVGSRWLTHGRGPGLDCAGLVVIALRNAGLTIDDNRNYDIKCPPRDMMMGLATKNGTLKGPDRRDPGMVFLMIPDGFVGVSHMGIISMNGEAIHMDIKRRQVVVDSSSWLKANCFLTVELNGLSE